VKLPPSIAALPEAERPAPNPDRWLPRKRKVSKREEREKIKREKGMMQGAAGADEIKVQAGQGKGKKTKK